MPRSIAAPMSSVAYSKGKRSAGLVPRHELAGFPQDPVQSPDWPAELTGADLVQWVYDGRSSELWSYLALPPNRRREIREDMPFLAFDTFAEAVFDPDDPNAE